MLLVYLTLISGLLNCRIVVISESHAPRLLAKINAITQSIDLNCKLLEPIVVGFIMSYVSMLSYVVILVVWNILSIGLEYWILYSMYYVVPYLNLKIRIYHIYLLTDRISPFF